MGAAKTTVSIPPASGTTRGRLLEGSIEMLKRICFLIVLLCFGTAGILLSYSLAEEYYFSTVTPGPGETLGFFTRISDQVCGDKSSFMSCLSVSESKYANLASTPLAILGVFFYTALTLLALLALSAPQALRQSISVLFFWAAALGSVLNLVLLGISIFFIESLCPLCLGTYVCCWGFLGAAVVLLLQHKASPFRLIHGIGFLFFKGGASTVLTRWAGFFAILLVSAGLAFGSNQLIKSQLDEYKNTKQKEVVEKIVRKFYKEKEVALDPPRTMMMGNPDAPVTIVEFSDFLCPYCAKSAAVIDELASDNPSKVKVIFVNYPLDRFCNKFVTRDMHRGACQLAMGAICAAEQDGFDEYQRLVFAAKPKNPNMRTMLNIAEQAGLAPLLFEKCITDQEILDMLLSQIEA